MAGFAPPVSLVNGARSSPFVRARSATASAAGVVCRRPRGRARRSGAPPASFPSALRASRSGGGRAHVRRAENVPGNFFVTEPCIDCDVCRWMAPGVFERVNGKTAVVRQPDDASEEQQLRALQAAAACPVGTIRTERPPPPAVGRRARDSFPIPVIQPHSLTSSSSSVSAVIDGSDHGDAAATPSIFHCGYHAAESFGATSYLVFPAGDAWRHAAVMVDSPRFFTPLAKNIRALLAREQRQLTYMFLTHIDDIADHAKWSEYFGMRRVMHMDDRHYYNDRELDAVEVPLRGAGPWRLTPDTAEFGDQGPDGDAASPPAEAVKIVHTPGHTPGSCTMIVNGVAAMTGDHLAFSRARQALGGFPGVCWYDWQMVIDSVRKLADERWTWCLPGHARRYRFESVEDMRRGVEQAAQRMDTEEWWAQVPAAGRRQRRRASIS